jgi:hypothetical protein
MHESTEEELISAYLDGELTTEEQAQVEQALAESAELRQIFEDLRMLSNNLQSLPRYRLDDQFADRVVRRAERSMLAPPTSESEPAANAGSVGSTEKLPTPEKHATATVPAWWRKKKLRALACAGALAASLLIVFFLWIRGEFGNAVNPANGGGQVAEPSKNLTEKDAVALEDKPQPSLVAEGEPDGRQLAVARELVVRCDQDGSGEISDEELKNFLKAHGELFEALLKADPSLLKETRRQPAAKD